MSATQSASAYNPTLAKQLSRYPYKLRMIPFDKLTVDLAGDPRVMQREARKGYQRLNESVAKRINRGRYSNLLFLPLIVNARADGMFAIGDGGGRYLYVQRQIEEGKASEATKIPCLVCEVPQDKEPMWFVNLNREKLGLTGVDIFLAELAANQDEAVQINRVVSAHGFRIGRATRKSRDVIGSIDALRKLYDDNPDANPVDDIDRALRLIKESGWADQEHGLKGSLIYGLGLIVKEHNPEHTDDYLLSAMREWTPNAVIRAAAASGMRNIGAGGHATGAQGREVFYILAQRINGRHGRWGAARRNSSRWINELKHFPKTPSNGASASTD